MIVDGLLGMGAALLKTIREPARLIQGAYRPKSLL
jgi:hypothetical protein